MEEQLLLVCAKCCNAVPEKMKALLTYLLIYQSLGSVHVQKLLGCKFKEILILSNKGRFPNHFRS